ncbi:hypothetical protein TNCV_4390661 [Trichonephila clavipes]|nr:hypothetical protein TNCV_4390661 [Trichonephila clavipes]
MQVICGYMGRNAALNPISETRHVAETKVECDDLVSSPILTSDICVPLNNRQLFLNPIFLLKTLPGNLDLWPPYLSATCSYCQSVVRPLGSSHVSEGYVIDENRHTYLSKDTPLGCG